MFGQLLWFGFCTFPFGNVIVDLVLAELKSQHIWKATLFDSPETCYKYILFNFWKAFFVLYFYRAGLVAQSLIRMDISEHLSVESTALSVLQIRIRLLWSIVTSGERVWVAGVLPKSALTDNILQPIGLCGTLRRLFGFSRFDFLNWIELIVITYVFCFYQGQPSLTAYCNQLWDSGSF